MGEAILFSCPDRYLLDNMLLGSLIWTGLTTIASPVFDNIMAVSTPDSFHHNAQLVLEVETFKEWLSGVKQFVDRLVASRVNLCSLMDFIDTLNAVQLFFYSNFVKPSKATIGFILRYPKWYRRELNHATKHIANASHTVLMELQVYELILQDQLLTDNVSLNDLRNAMRKQNKECKRFGDYYRSHMRDRSSWDVCESCTVRDTRYITLSQSYKRIVKDPSVFKDVQKGLENGKPVPEVVLPPMYGQHGEKGLLGRLGGMFSRTPASEIHLGEPLRSKTFDDDTESEDDL